MHKTSEQRREMRLQQRLERTLQFARALAGHVANGMPKSSQEQIDQRFAICKQCQHFSGQSCRVCNCGVNAKQYLLNKLYWKDQHCPDNPSRW